jgi:pyruvate dehydrogenase E1 component
MTVCQSSRTPGPGGKTLEDWIDNCSNAQYAALTYQGGGAWRERLMRDIGDRPHVAKLIAGYGDAGLGQLMTNLGGHCIETLIEAFDQAADDKPTRWSTKAARRQSRISVCLGSRNCCR